MHISNQLKASNCLGFRKKGIGTKHYTMTLWKNEEDMKSFAYSKAHMDAIKESKSIAKEIRTITIDGNDFPDWKEAKTLLESKGKSYFNKASETIK